MSVFSVFKTKQSEQDSKPVELVGRTTNVNLQNCSRIARMVTGERVIGMGNHENIVSVKTETYHVDFVHPEIVVDIFKGI